MKCTWLAVVLLGVAFPATAQTISIDLKSQPPLPPLTAKNVNPDMVRRACVQAVRSEETRDRRIEVLNASVVPSKEERMAACVVSAKVWEGPGILMSGGPFSTTEVRYSGTLNLETGKVDLARIDEDAAKQVALNALAAMFIDLKPTAIAPDKLVYKALVAGQKCTVELKNDSSPEPKRWQVSKVDCKP